jgi:Ca-activated chloride channel family protein
MDDLGISLRPRAILLAALLAATLTPPALGVEDVGSGELLWRSPDGLVPLPVLDLRVELEVTGVMVRGRLTQLFQNPTGEVIETVYAFPLPENAAVHQFEFRIGERRIVSVIQEREEARRTYTRARQEGKKAALLEQQRPNLFTTSVANIGPGEKIHVQLEYLQELEYDDGTFGIVFPLAFTPRFFPDGAHGEERLLADEMSGGASRRVTAGGVPLAEVIVRLRPGLPLEEVVSPSHDVGSWWEGETLVVEPRTVRVPADRDFTLRWRPILGREPQAAALVEERDDGRYLFLMLLPGQEERGTDTGILTETLFIVDVSGSMQGPSIRQARAALLAALERLHPDDTFNLLAFDDDLDEFGLEFMFAREENLVAAREWIRALRADGGTRIAPALRRGVELMKAGRTERHQRIIFLTDGAVGNEDEILRSVLRRLGDIRLHTLGIGSAPNRYLMARMARYGRGLSGFIQSTTGAGNEINVFLERLRRPVLTDLRLEWVELEPLEVYPERLPDLHAGEALYVSARLPSGVEPGEIRLHGLLGEQTRVWPVSLDETALEGSGVAVRWARARVGELMETVHRGGGVELVRPRVIEVSKRFHIVTAFTSLVAVEEFSSVTGEARTVLASGRLPRGGTDGPLILLVGILLTSAGAVSLGVALRPVPARRRTR